MTIVAVNGGGNTPQGVQLERCFVKSWSTSGDADDRPTDYKDIESLAVDPTNPNVDLSPMETPGPDDDVGLAAVQMDDSQFGEPVTFTFTVSQAPSSQSDSYAGSHALYQDLLLPY
jgi:hypothetical protein